MFLGLVSAGLPVRGAGRDGLHEMEGSSPGPPVPFLCRQSVGDAADDILFQKVNELFVRAAIKGLHKQHTCGILWKENKSKV